MYIYIYIIYIIYIYTHNTYIYIYIHNIKIYIHVYYIHIYIHLCIQSGSQYTLTLQHLAALATLFVAYKKWSSVFLGFGYVEIRNFNRWKGKISMETPWVFRLKNPGLVRISPVPGGETEGPEVAEVLRVRNVKGGGSRKPEILWIYVSPK